MLKQLILVFLFCWFCLNQACLNHEGQAVPWFLVINIPGSVSKGHLYYDSTFTTTGFAYKGQGSDSPGNPIYNTLQTLNNDQVKLMAWNDQIPSEATSLNKKKGMTAHSKSIIAFNSESGKGIVIDHSMPKFPTIDQDGVNPKIGSSQSIYGQHFLCISTSKNITDELLTKSSIINADVYSNSTGQSFNMKTQNLFQYAQFKVKNTSFKVIFKNGKINGSIYQDGLTQYLESDILAESWGRPLQDVWCGNSDIPYKVGNVQTVSFNDHITWSEKADHSKWAIATSKKSQFSCFGDMNRMKSQWKRGGVFYCLSHAGLKKTMTNFVKASSVCQ